MKLMTLFTIALLFTACDTSNRIFRDGEKGNTGTSCTTSQTETGSIIKCTDGSISVINDGQNGKSCTTVESADNSGALILCEDGRSVFIKNGIDGVNGQDAMSVTMIQLCSNITGHYPDEFPEYAFNVGGKLYAVYNSNNHDSALVELYPGTYRTTSPNQNCTFTVNQDRTITN